MGCSLLSPVTMGQRRKSRDIDVVGRHENVLTYWRIRVVQSEFVSHFVVDEPAYLIKAL